MCPVNIERGKNYKTQTTSCCLLCGFRHSNILVLITWLVRCENSVSITVLRNTSTWIELKKTNTSSQWQNFWLKNLSFFVVFSKAAVFPLRKFIFIISICAILWLTEAQLVWHFSRTSRSEWCCVRYLTCSSVTWALGLSESGYCFLNEVEAEAKITVPSSGLAWWLQSCQASIQGVVNTGSFILFIHKLRKCIPK